MRQPITLSEADSSWKNYYCQKPFFNWLIEKNDAGQLVGKYHRDVVTYLVEKYGFDMTTQNMTDKDYRVLKYTYESFFLKSL